MVSEPYAQMPGPSARKREALELFAPLPRHYDAVATLLSFGQDPRWRAAMVQVVRARPAERVLDVATGTGLVAQALARRYGCSVVGLDQSPEMLGRARARVAGDPELGRRVSLVGGEAERLPFGSGEFDHLTFTYLLRYVDDPQATLSELARVLRPGGRIASLEFAVPERAVWRAAWSLYTRIGLPVLGRAVSREWAHTGRFLAESIPAFYERWPIPRLVELWREAGIVDVKVRRMSLGGGIVMWGEKGAREKGEGEREALEQEGAQGQEGVQRQGVQVQDVLEEGAQGQERVQGQGTREQERARAEGEAQREKAAAGGDPHTA